MDAFALRYSTDTAHPQDIVPIYFIHSINAPLCDRPGCWCRKNEAKVAELLAGVALSKLRLEEAAPLTEVNTNS